MRGVSYFQSDGRGSEGRCLSWWEWVRGVSHVQGDGRRRGVSYVQGVEEG